MGGGIGLNIHTSDDVEAVEIYRDYREIPLELRRSMLGSVVWPDDNFACGAALVWTKAGW
jgi:hypothetical protein